MEDRSLSARARKKVKEQAEKSQKERQVKLFHKRMELARQGTIHYKQGQMKEAVNCYYRYFDILEQWKSVKPGMLELKHFDQKKDIAELLLMTGILWDLAKLYDRAGKKEEVRLKSFLDKYIQFSKGMPYQVVCAELVRKFLVNGNPMHRSMFKDVYIQLGGGKCFIATAVEDFCEPNTLPRLREFRDQILLKRKLGRIFVSTYYQTGPFLARLVLKSPLSFQHILAKLFDRIAQKIRISYLD